MSLNNAVAPGRLIDGAKACGWGLATEAVETGRNAARALEVMAEIKVAMIEEEVLMTCQKPLDKSPGLKRR